MTGDREQPPPEPVASGATLRDLVAECLERLEREGEGALEALCRSHPALAEALRTRIAHLRAMGLVGATGGTPVPGSADFPERLGEFRLLARLGGGGMGVVYVAEQSRLGRRVALKVVRPELLFFPGARERFAREVEALARLQHPGIVPVHAGGEEQGVPFLAMELVRGATLDEALAELAGRVPASLTGADLRDAVRTVVARQQERLAGPRRAPDVRTGGPPDARVASSSGGEAAGRLFGGPWPATCLRIARQVAEALQHAHEQGVLHRDVKPSNIMLTPEGRVLLLDFGLATAEGSVSLTRSGSPLGSPAYMAPEQVRGEATDARSDVYSLGVTLLELLTLRSPFAAETVERTRHLVLAGQPVAPRDANPTVPRDAETVCLVALDRDPARRYASAAALAADLGNVLELRPIAARRPGALLHARRWAQRHPAAATALVAGALLFVGAPSFFLVQQQRANARIQDALDDARAERDLAQANFERAREAVNVLLTEVAEEELLTAPGMQEVRQRLLESALRFHEEFLAERGADPEQALQTGQSALLASTLLIELGRSEEAIAAAERGAELARAHLAAAPDDPAGLDLLGDACSALSRTLSMVGRLDEARVVSDEGLARRRRAVELQPRDAVPLRDLCDALGNRAHMALSVGDYAEALRFYDESIAVLETMLPAVLGSELETRTRSGLVIALCNRSFARERTGEPRDQLLPDVERALEIAEGLDDLARLETFEVMGLANASLRQAQLLGQFGRAEEAEAAYVACLDVLEWYLARQPLSVEVHGMRSTALNGYGLLLDRLPGREADARALLEQGVQSQRDLVRVAPDVPLHRARLGASLVNTASGLRDEGELARARTLFEEAVQLGRETRAEMPGHPDPPVVLHNGLWFLSLTCLDLGDLPGAVEAARTLAADCPGGKPLRIAAGLLARAADRLEQDGVPDTAARVAELRAQALEHLQRAAAAGYADASNLDSATELVSLRALDGFAAVREAVSRNAAPVP